MLSSRGVLKYDRHFEETYGLHLQDKTIILSGKCRADGGSRFPPERHKISTIAYPKTITYHRDQSDSLQSVATVSFPVAVQKSR